jgi:hypothetical protein
MPRLVLVALVMFFAISPITHAQHPAPHMPAPRAYAPPPIYRAPTYRPYAFPATSYRGTSAALSRPWWPIYPYRRFPVGPNSFFIQPYWYLWSTWAYNSCGWTNCYLNWNLGYNNTLQFYTYAPNYAPLQNYLYYGEQSRDLPELILTDGTVYSVSDYWVVDNQVHFIVADRATRQPEEQVIPLDDLDLQTTIDVNTRRGFRFVLRNEPIAQYLHDHPDEPPPTWSVPASSHEKP